VQFQVVLILPGGGQFGSILLISLGEFINILSCIIGCLPGLELGPEVIKTVNRGGPDGLDKL
jgi:hypothetical protein